MPMEVFSSTQVVKLYARRMQGEEIFRDLKRHGLRQNSNHCPNRYDVLLLIGFDVSLWLDKEARQRPEYSIIESHFRRP
ncbi:hypothetical protein KE622_06020 [Shewanella algae]|nr:hypothetical protein BS332_11230 [Shewanella algae]MBC8797070.1 hypothetical protein [Shewanella algae]MBO2599506.1 hypothetical protein [Shewanella algae]MBO2606446.1 hypothetical protein [Shewanella algae]QHD52485.1 hypothetical protein GM320_04515 [Shewanella algae]